MEDILDWDHLVLLVQEFENEVLVLYVNIQAKSRIPGRILANANLAFKPYLKQNCY